MSPKKLNSYTGKLNPEQIAEGINIANCNALRLLEDAQILFNAGRYPSAAAFAILSIEESGKIPILRSLSTARTTEEIIKVWRDYRSHIKKNVLWPFVQLVHAGLNTLEDFRPLFDPNSEHPFILDQIKQISLYTDCLGKAHWSEPSKVIDKELSASLIQTAKILASKHETTSREIELWIKHISGVDPSDYKKANEALLHWYYDMQASGLLPEGYKMSEISLWLGFDFGLAKD